jgi:hypothetical protein
MDRDAPDMEEMWRVVRAGSVHERYRPEVPM